MSFYDRHAVQSMIVDTISWKVFNLNLIDRQPLSNWHKEWLPNAPIELEISVDSVLSSIVINMFVNQTKYWFFILIKRRFRVFVRTQTKYDL